MPCLVGCKFIGGRTFLKRLWVPCKGTLRLPFMNVICCTSHGSNDRYHPRSSSRSAKPQEGRQKLVTGLGQKWNRFLGIYRHSADLVDQHVIPLSRWSTHAATRARYASFVESTHKMGLSVPLPLGNQSKSTPRSTLSFSSLSNSRVTRF